MYLLRDFVIQEPGQFIHQHHILDGRILASHSDTELVHICCLAQCPPPNSTGLQGASYAGASILHLPLPKLKSVKPAV